MTVRDFITKRVRLLVLVFLFSWLFIIASSMFAEPHAFRILVWFGFAGAAVAIIGMNFLVSCPRCHAQLGKPGLSMPFSSRENRLNSCPHCGVPFDNSL
jgi:hypothetical protein